MSEEKPEAPSGPKKIIIDPAGDVLLAIGEPPVSLLVSTKVLSVASDVFRAMFGPRFVEGQDLTERWVVHFRRSVLQKTKQTVEI